MKLRLDQLESHLQRSLLPVYLLSGDEPLQMMEAGDAIIAAAKKQGYDDRELMVVEPQFDWGRLRAAAVELSLFSSYQLYDLRLQNGKPGNVGGKALREYVQRLSDDKILLVRTGRLDAAMKKSAWVSALEKAGAMIQIWDLSPAQTLGWVSRRMRDAGLKPTNGAVKLITERVEGNLLAANQEIQKLVLLLGQDGLGQRLDEEHIMRVVSDSSRFSVFDLVDAVLLGDRRRIEHIMRVLREEGVALVLVSWALTNVSRQLYQLIRAQRRHESNAAVMRSIPKPRQALLSRAMPRHVDSDWSYILGYNATIDRLVKGQVDVPIKDVVRIWGQLLDYAFILSGKPVGL